MAPTAETFSGPSASKMPSGATRSTLAATKFTNPVKFCIMAGTDMPRSHRGTGVSPMLLDEESALHLVRLPQLHNEPFDSILVCQALIHGLVILTPDKLISQYPVRTIW